MMRSIRGFLAILMVVSAAASARADWLWTRQLISGVGAIRSLAYGNGIFVAGTNTGYLLSTRDTATWTITRPATRSVNDVIFAHDKFVASIATVSGASCQIFYSRDGVDWVPARRVANNGVFRNRTNLTVLASNGGRFIGLGPASQAFAASVNGTRWQAPLHGRPRKYVGSVTGLANHRGYLLCSTLAGATIQASKDGTEWTTRFMTSSRGPARGIAAQKTGDRLVCVGENGLCLTSSNGGDTWASHPLGSADLLGTNWANSLFLSFSERTVYSSPAGIFWTPQLKVARSADHIRAVAGGAGLWIAAGSNGKNGLIFTSSGLPGPSAPQ